MSNSYFQFKRFTVHQEHCAMKVTTDACLFGAWAGNKIENEKLKIENVLDIGTGTGLLSLMLAQKNQHTKIDAVEMDGSAAEQAKENVRISPWKDNIQIINADIKKVAFSGTYDLVISNPPFYENELKSTDEQKNLAHHSENLLLQELVTIIGQTLQSQGQFYLLLPYKRMTEAGVLIQKNGLLITHTALVRQTTGHDFFRVMIEGRHIGSPAKTYSKNEISIWDSERQYTKEFVKLLKDYYLYL